MRSLLIIALIYTSLSLAKTDESNIVSITRSISDFDEHKVELEKSETQTESGFFSNQIQQSTNDEPFRPIYGPISTQYNAESTDGGYFSSQILEPQESRPEVYYDKPQLMTGIRYVATEHNAIDSKPTQKASTATATATAILPPHSGVPLLGSYLSSSGGIRYAPSSYQGPFSPGIYEAKQQQQQQQQHQQQHSKSVQHTEKKLSTSTDNETKILPLQQSDVKISQNNLVFTEPVANFFRNVKPLQQKQEQQHQQQHQPQQQQQYQPIYHQEQQREQTYFQPFLQPHTHHSIYNPQHQHQSLSLHNHHHKQQQQQEQPQPQLQLQQEQQHQQHQHASPQHHIQYIIAIPLSHVRQLQQQLAFQQHSSSPTSLATPTVIGPLSRDHYGAYRALHYPNNHPTEHVPPAVHHYQHQEPQHAPTQYIQLPNSVLHAAVQAAHFYHHPHQQNPKSKQKTQDSSSYQQTQPQYVYYPHQQQQHNRQQEPEQQTTHQHPTVHANEKPQLHKFQQETIIHIGGTKPSAKSTPTKTSNDNVPLLPTPASTAALKAQQQQHALAGASSPAEPLPVVHYNPIYVQAPPPEQQPLFDTLNYQRFASGGFPATTPVPLIRLSATPSQHYYSALSHLPQHPIHQLHAHHQPLPHFHFHPHQHPHPHPHSLPLPQHQHQLHTPQAFHKTIFNTYSSEQIPSIVPASLPFHFPQHQHYPHYNAGVQFYHQHEQQQQQPTPAYIATPAIPAKATATVNAASVGNQHRQQQEPQQTLHRQHTAPPDSVNSGARAAVSSGSATNSLVKYP